VSDRGDWWVEVAGWAGNRKATGAVIMMMVVVIMIIIIIIIIILICKCDVAR
jgi:heme/copper-type cytochrome/quinol oxidase subunit 2